MEIQDGERACDARVPQPQRAWMPAVVGMVVVALLGGIVVLAAGDALRPAMKVRVVPVVFDRAIEADRVASLQGGSSVDVPRKTVQAPGWLEADPFYVACAALADGVIEEILVLEGDRVEAGQVVARLVAEDAWLALSRAGAALGAAQAGEAMARAELDAAESDWQHPVERERAVRTAAAALDGAKAELAQLPSLIAAEAATHARLVEERTRIEMARAGGAATDIEVIIIQKDVDAQRARLNATELREGILVARVGQMTAEHSAAVKNAELLIEERRALGVARAMVQLREAEVSRAQAARDESALRHSRMTIHSPITGYVQSRLKVPGDKVMMRMDSPQSSQILHLYDPASLQVRVDVPLADAAHIRVGQVCEVVVDVLPDTVFRGEVTRITHEADLQKNTLQVKVRIYDPSEFFRPEMLTRVKFVGGGVSRGEAELGRERATVLIPSEAFHDRAGERATVWVISNRQGDYGIAEAVDVTVLSVEGVCERVSASLHVGDLLITNSHTPSEGQRVRMHEAGSEA